MHSNYMHNDSDNEYEAEQQEERDSEALEYEEEQESVNADEEFAGDHSDTELLENDDEREATSDYQRDEEGNGEDKTSPPMPPSGVQNYGLRGANDDDGQSSFQYSQCTGNRKALFIGINYFGQEGELHGCINDVRNIKEFIMERFGYQTENMITLTDDEDDPTLRPTKDNIIQAMHWLVSDAQPNDSLFLHYSGHGGQGEDGGGDEGDGFDETLCPEDYETAGMIVDEELHDILVKPLPSGCRLTAIFDCCHSGSILDLPFMYSTEGKLKEPNFAADAGKGLLQAVTSYAKGDVTGAMRSAMGLVKNATRKSEADKVSKATKTSSADCISFSGCKDDQTSADAQENGEATGAMSHALVSTLTEKPHQSYQELLVNVREILKSKYSQKPQLSASHPIDTKLMFII